MLPIILNVVTGILVVYVVSIALACTREQRKLQALLKEVQLAHSHFSKQITQLESLAKEAGIIERNCSIHDTLQNQSEEVVSSEQQIPPFLVAWRERDSLIQLEEELDDLDSIVSEWDKNSVLAYLTYYTNAIALTKKEHSELFKHTLSKKSELLRRRVFYSHRVADLHPKFSETKWEENDYFRRICNA